IAPPARTVAFSSPRNRETRTRPLPARRLLRLLCQIGIAVEEAVSGSGIGTGSRRIVKDRLSGRRLVGLPLVLVRRNDRLRKGLCFDMPVEVDEVALAAWPRPLQMGKDTVAVVETGRILP